MYKRKSPGRPRTSKETVLKIEEILTKVHLPYQQRTWHSLTNCVARVNTRSIIGVILTRSMKSFACICKGETRKILRGGPNFATFNVTSFSYNGILPFVNYARRYYEDCCTKLRQCECNFTDLMKFYQEGL